MAATANTTVQDSYKKNPHLNASVENVCVWLQQNGLGQYCDQFRDYSIDEFMLITDDYVCELFCRSMKDEKDRAKFIRAREELLNMQVREPQTPEPEIASANNSRKDVQTIVTNNFIRYGENNQVVMTGDATVVNIRQGDYTAADLCKKWLDSKWSGKQMINPEDVKIIKNVQWRHKSAIGPSAEAGHLIFPADFDGNLPSVVATTQNLKYYDCSFANETQVKVSLPIEHEARVYTYNPNYVQEWVLAKNGPGLERHNFTHLDLPLSSDSGWFVLGKFNDENETELHLTAFVIPQNQTLLVPPNVIHSNDYLKGQWRTMLANADIDIVRMKRQRHAGPALQPFAFDFPGANAQLKLERFYVCASCKSKPCPENLSCLIQFSVDGPDHNSNFSHPCHFSELCKDQEPHLTHEPHEVPKCSHDKSCNHLCNPIHRVKYCQTGYPAFSLLRVTINPGVRTNQGNFQTNFYLAGQNYHPSQHEPKPKKDDHDYEQRIPCKWGSECRETEDDQHCKKYSHPTAAQKKDDHRIPCKWGSECRETEDDQHCKKYSHPTAAQKKDDHRIPCKWGSECRETEDDHHCKKYSHPSAATKKDHHRIPCKWGTQCHEHSSDHQTKYSHPSQDGGHKNNGNHRIPCKWDTQCQDHSSDHRVNFSHHKS